MKRNEVRSVIKEFLLEFDIKALSSDVADKLAIYLQEKYPSTKFGNSYNIECKFDDFFCARNVCGKIDRCDSFEESYVLDSVTFDINKDLQVMVWDKEPFALTLDMDNLSDDDLIDINNINNQGKIDVYTTFMRIGEKNRGKLASKIPNSEALELFDKDIPPFAFYEYDGLFYHTTRKAVGDLGGGVGFGGYVREQGSVAEISNTVISIGSHAFDGCKNLTKVYISSNVNYIGKHAFANIPDLVIYCNLPSKPDTWDNEWCDENCTVYFNN